MTLQSLSESALVTQSGTALSTTIDEEAVILEQDSGMYYGLNEVGAHIWTDLDEPRTVAELRESILAEYDVDRGRCDYDLETILTELEEHGLVQIGGQ